MSDPSSFLCSRNEQIINPSVVHWWRKWIEKMWYIYTMEYYSALKKNEITPFAVTQMDQGIVILSEVRQRQISDDVTYMWNIKKGYT